ncbi:hypothetical protein SLU01_11680 [Sporosarcina luteola]|uniref:AAA+ ATPase domain-containing protein n=1 Tax=Sporosarcina luteola TaxID=582850 RepID=A0A511Z5Y9_9BACL|nr:AAA family ATPase [Sporosarcina luteola]GEN82856.1 hypothetical protein SLU01_11680 [Sporosarcina luteola]
MIKSLSISEWNQFSDIKIDFHSKVTIITGANGAGKSTILRLLAKEIGWHYSEVATLPEYNNNSKFVAGLFGNTLKRLKQIMPYLNNFEEYDISNDNVEFGEIELDKGTLKLYVPKRVDASYNIITNFISHEEEYYYPIIEGINIASHKEPYGYTKVSDISLNPSEIDVLLSKYTDSIKDRIVNQIQYSNDSPTYLLKKSLISLAILGEGNMYVSPNEDYKRWFFDFQEVLKKILPSHIGFSKLVVKDGEVFLITKTGNFLIDALSGGLAAVVDLCWQIYVHEINSKDSFVVLIDEIENHLHPSLQREILPKLINAFPDLQFIVTTHSPFVVNSLENSTVYALKFRDDNKVMATKLDFKAQAKDAFKVLRDVLGVPVTFPVWVEEELNKITGKYLSEGLKVDNLQVMKEELNRKNLYEYLPEMLSYFHEDKYDKD